MRHESILVALVFIGASFLSGCVGGASSVNQSNQNDPDTVQQLETGIAITYGFTLPPGESYYDVIVDGKPRKSLFTQKNLDFATKSTISREEYENAFLDVVACIEERGGWIHYDLDAEVIDFTYTTASDPNGYCEQSHFYFPSGLWNDTHYKDESEQLWFYINCLKDNGVVPVHAEPAEEFGPPQWDQNHELQVQAREEGVECGSFVESFYEDAPYPE